MKSDIYSIYLEHTNRFGFWLTKPNWENYVAQVLKISGITEGEFFDRNNNPAVIALLLDMRTNQIEDIVELASPEKQQYIKLDKEFKPNYAFPDSIRDYLKIA